LNPAAYSPPDDPALERAGGPAPVTGTPHIEIFGLRGLPEIEPGAALGLLIASAVERNQLRVAARDVFIVAHKVVSKAEGRLVALDSVQPRAQAIAWAEKYEKDARTVELVFREARRIVKMERGVIVAETHHGFVCANAGVDLSNVPPGTAALLPLDPDVSARQLQVELSAKFGVALAVIVSDTFGRPWRRGLVNVALGVAGMAGLADYRGRADGNGRRLQATVMARADELAAGAELVMGKSERVPVAILRGLAYEQGDGTGRALLRDAKEDLFR
jgi:coenzyme F420-0:L-glutamate ligase / coenzyme F420-1:gamma-L-glutamate ligase